MSISGEIDAKILMPIWLHVVIASVVSGIVCKIQLHNELIFFYPRQDSLKHCISAMGHLPHNISQNHLCDCPLARLLLEAVFISELLCIHYSLQDMRGAA